MKGTENVDWVGGPIDTTGASPLVRGCRAALDAMDDVSATLAALPPTRVFGDVLVRKDQTFELALAPGEVVSIDSLITEPAKTNEDYGCFTGNQASPILSITGGPAVVNVARLELGACADGAAYDEQIVYNVPGNGRAVRIGYNAKLEGALLAPRRTVIVTGTTNDSWTGVRAAWAKKLQLIGYVIGSGSAVVDACPQ